MIVGYMCSCQWVSTTVFSLGVEKAAICKYKRSHLTCLSQTLIVFRSSNCYFP